MQNGESAREGGDDRESEREERDERERTCLQARERASQKIRRCCALNPKLQIAGTRHLFHRKLKPASKLRLLILQISELEDFPFLILIRIGYRLCPNDSYNPNQTPVSS